MASAWTRLWRWMKNHMFLTAILIVILIIIAIVTVGTIFIVLYFAIPSFMGGVKSKKIAKNAPEAAIQIYDIVYKGLMKYGGNGNGSVETLIFLTDITSIITSKTSSNTIWNANVMGSIKYAKSKVKSIPSKTPLKNIIKTVNINNEKLFKSLGNLTQPSKMDIIKLIPDNIITAAYGKNMTYKPKDKVHRGLYNFAYIYFVSIILYGLQTHISSFIFNAKIPYSLLELNDHPLKEASKAGSTLELIIKLKGMVKSMIVMGRIYIDTYKFLPKIMKELDPYMPTYMKIDLKQFNTYKPPDVKILIKSVKVYYAIGRKVKDYHKHIIKSKTTKMKKKSNILSRAKKSISSVVNFMKKLFIKRKENPKGKEVKNIEIEEKITEETTKETIVELKGEKVYTETGEKIVSTPKKKEEIIEIKEETFESTALGVKKKRRRKKTSRRKRNV